MIKTWSEGIADDNMAEDILVTLADLIHRHPWWRARSRLTLSLLDQLGIRPPAPVFDAGCGWGTTFLALEKAGYKVTGMDISRRAVERLDRPDRDLVIADLDCPVPPEMAIYDAVMALDVIEHIDDDRAAVTKLGQIVRPGGVVIVSVPARPELFTEFDEIQGHRRRYLPETLRAAFDGSGLQLERVFWWGQWLVPMIRRQRAKAKKVRPDDSPTDIYRRYLKLPPWPGAYALDLGFALEREKAITGKLKTGTSLFAVARRPLST
jgi:2-polyprenyl-3-methyl-5-hydroxy-6-metoxy-1,4-benzoquinol methylase